MNVSILVFFFMYLLTGICDIFKSKLCMLDLIFCCKSTEKLTETIIRAWSDIILSYSVSKIVRTALFCSDSILVNSSLDLLKSTKTYVSLTIICRVSSYLFSLIISRGERKSSDRSTRDELLTILEMLSN